MVYILLFFSSKFSLFHNSNVFVSCIIHILYTGYAKIKKKIRHQKVKRYRLSRGDGDSSDCCVQGFDAVCFCNGTYAFLFKFAASIFIDERSA